MLYNLIPQEYVDVVTEIALYNYAFENQFQKEETKDRIIYMVESHFDTGGMEVKRLDPTVYGTNIF